MKGALIDIFQPGRLDCISVHSFETLAESTRFIRVSKRTIHRKLNLNYGNRRVLYGSLNIMLEKGCFEMALEQKLPKLMMMMQISLPYLTSMSRNFKPHIPTLPDRSSSADSNEQREKRRRKKKTEKFVKLCHMTRPYVLPQCLAA